MTDRFPPNLVLLFPLNDDMSNISNILSNILVIRVKFVIWYISISEKWYSLNILNSNRICQNMQQFTWYEQKYAGICATKCYHIYTTSRAHIDVVAICLLRCRKVDMHICDDICRVLLHIGEIVDICVEYLYIASRKKQVDMSVYCSARDMWVCDHVPCHIYVQSIWWRDDAILSLMVWDAHNMSDIHEIRE